MGFFSHIIGMIRGAEKGFSPEIRIFALLPPAVGPTSPRLIFSTPIKDAIKLHALAEFPFGGDAGGPEGLVVRAE